MYSCVCSALFTALCACVDVSRLSTAGVFRDEEESVSPPLSDIGDDWNINGPRRAEPKQCPSRFIQQSRGCDGAKSECEWSQTLLSVMFKLVKPSLVFVFEHIFKEMSTSNWEVKDQMKYPTYFFWLFLFEDCFWPQWKHKSNTKKVNNEPLRLEKK